VVTHKNGMLGMSRINVIFLTNVENWPINGLTLLLASTSMQHIQRSRPTSSNSVHVPRQTCGKVRQGVERITTQLNSTTSDNVLRIDFNSRDQPKCLGRFVVHAFQRMRKRQLR